MKPLSRIIAFAFVAAFICGCAHYRLGSGGKLGFETLYIAPVENSSMLPQATAAVSTQIREAFLRDGRVTLVSSPDDADATLTVVLGDFDRDVLTSRPDDTGLARKFDLIVHAACTLRDNRSGALVFENRPIDVRRQIFATATPTQKESDQLQAEYQAVPLLAASLGDSIAHATLDVW